MEILQAKIVDQCRGMEQLTSRISTGQLSVRSHVPIPVGLRVAGSTVDNADECLKIVLVL